MTQLSIRQALWLKIAFILAFLGLAISSYAAFHHWEVVLLGKTNAACNISQIVSCDRVALSDYSIFLGAPMGVWGIGYFFTLLVLCFMIVSLPRFRSPLKLIYGTGVGAGFLVSLVLAAISFGLLGAVCLNCVGIYLVTIGQAVALFSFWEKEPQVFKKKPLVFLGTLCLVCFFIPVQLAKSLFFQPDQPPQSPDLKPIPVYEIPITKTPYKGLGEDQRKGSETPLIQIIKFSDFQCPACKTVAQDLDLLLKEFPKELSLVYRHYPLDPACNSDMDRPLHPFACELAILSRCAGDKDLFWAFHDLAFQEQTASKPREWAQKVGLSEEEIGVCLKEPRHLKKIQDDIAVARSVGVQGTPTLFFNGKRVEARGLEPLRQAVLDELNIQKP
jgi:protein-disulfide isomerase/uncharacterized membrane protein